MSFMYLDDSKHHQRGFSLATFVICDEDPQAELASIISGEGFDPKTFEFKSSLLMSDNASLRSLRTRFSSFIFFNCKIAVCVVNGDKNIGPASLCLLEKCLGHDRLHGGQHEVFFDQGLFSSVAMAQRTANSISGFEGCELHFEQDSKTVFGLQVADLAAHTCATMLSETLGLVTKSVKINHPGYADIDEVNLGFLLWAGVRYNFLSTSKTDNPDHLDFATLDAEKYGLFIHESATDLVSKAAKERFGTMYVGCIH